MAEEGEPQIEVAESFFVLDDFGSPREAECAHCNKRACVRCGAMYYCARCWEFLPQE